MTKFNPWLEQYKHPNWQKKRLEVLERDKFTCCHCEEKEKTLHVHHKWYQKGKKVWEYPNVCFITLCDECHDHWHFMQEQQKIDLYDWLVKDGWDLWDIEHLVVLASFNKTKTIKNFCLEIKKFDE